MAFLFWLGIRGARNAVVRPNAFLRRKSAAFSACNAENIRKCNRHGGGAAAGVSRLSFHFPFSKISRISLVMRPDPDLTQTGVRRSGFIEIYLTKQHKFLCFHEYFERFSGGCNLHPPLWFPGSNRVSDGVSDRVCRALFHSRRRVDVGAEGESCAKVTQRFRQCSHVHTAFQR